MASASATERRRTSLAADLAEALFPRDASALARHGGEMNEPDRLLRRAAAGTRNAGDGNREVGGGARERAAHHRFRGLAADCAEFFQHLRRHVEHRLLGRVRIGDETAVDHVGRAGNFGQRGCHQPAGA